MKLKEPLPPSLYNQSQSLSPLPPPQISDMVRPFLNPCFFFFPRTFFPSLFRPFFLVDFRDELPQLTRLPPSPNWRTRSTSRVSFFFLCGDRYSQSVSVSFFLLKLIDLLSLPPFFFCPIFARRDFRQVWRPRSPFFSIPLSFYEKG